MSRMERWEVICGLAWFSSDGFWLMQWHLPCYIAGTVALFAAMMIGIYTPLMPTAMMVCLGDSAWLLFNILWSVGDLWPDDGLARLAKLFFGLGATFYVIAFFIGSGHQMILRRLRLLRLVMRSRNIGRGGFDNVTHDTSGGGS